MAEHKIEYKLEDFDNEKIDNTIKFDKSSENTVEFNNSQINNLNTIRKTKYWSVEEIRPYIIEYLKNRCPNSVIEREFDYIDIMVHGYNIPVEIQRTYLVKGKNSESPAISNFENVIRKQIEQNISISGQCWFFFDAEYLRYLQNDVTTNSSMNMDWFYKLFKFGKLKIFTITFNGIIKEMKDEDFKFIKKFSSTCQISIDEDERILERNKSKIAYNVYKNCEFNTEEINKWYDEFEKSSKGKGSDFSLWLSNSLDKRQKKLGIIKSQGLRRIININNMLKCQCNEGKLKDSSYAYNLGIIDRDYKYIKCIDKYDILQYFPGYMKNKELWEYLKIYPVYFSTFSSIVKGIRTDFAKIQNNLMEY